MVVVGSVALGVLLVWTLRQVLTLAVVAAFLAVVLSPPVNFLVRRGLRRGLATVGVFATLVVLLLVLGYAFLRPIYASGRRFATDLPRLVEEAKRGEGRVGELVQRYNVEGFVEENAPRLRKSLDSSGGPVVRTLQRVANGLFGIVTILVLAVFMLLEGPGLLSQITTALEPERARRLARIGADAAKAVTGYTAGNLAISLAAGSTSFVFLSLVGVPFALVLSLWVGVADLLPLIGATLGAIPTVLIAFLHSTGAGVAVLVYYVIYQQFENHFLQPAVMSRTVKLNPLWVLLAVLAGVELAGFLGALLAIPAAGVIQVVAGDLWEYRRGSRPAPTATGSSLSSGAKARSR